MNKPEALTILGGYNSGKYYRYGDLSRFLQAYAAAYPELCRLDSLGQSPEGREIWTVTLTNFATGPDGRKPAYHINGQHHAGEVVASAVSLSFIHHVLTGYGTDAAVTELLDTRVVYVVPRLTVDGTEWYFDHWPEDVDGDGMILQVRAPHPLGEWKVSAKDPRLMVRRRPEDREGTACLISGGCDLPQATRFYRMYTEGFIRKRQPDGTVAPEYDGRGFEPEVRALAAFWLQHPNIGAAMSYHTSVGACLRPSAVVGDEKLNPFDLQMYRLLGETCTRLTGYPTMSSYEQLPGDRHPDRLDVGSWLEWSYDQRGVQAFETELWNFPSICGVKFRPLKERKSLSPEQLEEEALLRLQWVDKELGGEGFTDWRPFDHPQLGRVEIGGFDPKFLGQNPPEKLLHQVCHKNVLFALEHALATPLLRIGSVAVTPVGGKCYSVAAQVLNCGYLPTSVTEIAVEQKLTRPVEAVLTGDVRVVGGKVKQELGQIAGRGSGAIAVWAGAVSPTTEKWAEWVVQGEAGAAFTIDVKHDRGGSVSRTVTLS